jgi:glutathione S-transferase
MSPQATHELVLTRSIAAPRARVYDAFLDPKLLAAWFAPRGFTVPHVEIRAVIEGGYNVTMRTRSGEQFSVAGRYRELSPPERLVFTWVWQDGPMAALGETLVTVNLREQGEHTEVELRHSGFPSTDARARHVDGWSGCLNKLVDLLDREGEAASITLYGGGRSSYVRSVVMGLAEKGLRYKHEPLMPNTPAQLAVHPFGRIPALRDGDLVLFETSAILRYLDESFDGPSLLPPSARQRAKMEQWVSAVSCYVYEPCVRNYVLQFLFAQQAQRAPDRTVIERALPEIARVLGIFENGYADGPFLAGGALSMADLLLAPVVASVRAFPEGQAIVESLPKLYRAHQVICDRKSFQLAHAVFG